MHVISIKYDALYKKLVSLTAAFIKINGIIVDGNMDYIIKSETSHFLAMVDQAFSVNFLIQFYETILC